MAVARGVLAVDPEVMKCKQPLQEQPWHQHLIVLFPILAVYLCLAFYRIDHQSLWLDEVLSIIRADSEGTFLAAEGWSAGHGPLYFRLLHLWVQWSTSQFGIRAFSTIFGAIAVGLTYLIGLRLFNRRVACIAAILLATSPFVIWYSQEVRYVLLMMAAALAATYTFHRALDAKGPGWWALYCCSLLIAVAAFVVNVFLLLAHGFYLACSLARRPVLRRWLVCQLVVLALFVWWANDGRVDQLGGYWRRLFVHVTTGDQHNPSVHPSESLVTGGAREFTVMALPYTFFVFSTGFSLGPSLRELQISRSLAMLRSHALVLSICGVLFGSLCIFGIAALSRRSDMGTFLICWVGVPILGVFGVSALIPAMAYNVRYTAMGLPAYGLILAVGITSLRRPLLQMILIAAVLMVNGLSLRNYYFNPSYAREDARSAAQYLEAVGHPEAMILVVGSTRALQYYYKGRLPLFSLDKADIQDRSILLDRLKQFSKEHSHAWLVMIRPWEVDPKGKIKEVFDSKYIPTQHRELPGVDIYSYQLH